MTSTARSAMRLASSWMVIASGIVTSRTIFSVGIWKPCACFFRRSVRRRKAATERARSSSSSSALDERQLAAPLLGLGLGAASARGALTSRLTPGRALARASSSSATCGSRALGGKLLGRFFGLLAWPSSSTRWRASSSALRRRRLRAPCARASSCRGGGALLLPGACAPRPRARAHRQGAVARFLLFRRQRAQHDARARLGRVSGARRLVGLRRNPRLGLELRLGLGAGRSSSLGAAGRPDACGASRPPRLGAAVGEILLDPALLDRARARSRCVRRAPEPPSLRSLVSFVSVMLLASLAASSRAS